MEDKTERIEHASVQEAIDYAIGRVLTGLETVVHLRGIQQQSVTFKPQKKNPAPAQRIGDSLRQERLDLLGLAFVQGFITQQEWDQRAAAVLSATTRADLAHLTLDLAEVEKPELPVSHLPVSHRHKICVDLPAVIALMALAVFAGIIIGVILT